MRQFQLSADYQLKYLQLSTQLRNKVNHMINPFVCLFVCLLVCCLGGFSTRLLVSQPIIFLAEYAQSCAKIREVAFVPRDRTPASHSGGSGRTQCVRDTATQSAIQRDRP